MMTIATKSKHSTATAIRVLNAEADALRAMALALPRGFENSIDLMAGARGRVIVSGMGKSGHIARKIAATLASTGTPAMFLHPGEASHGDLGMVTVDDVCLLLSNSGETREMSDLIQYTRRFDIPMIAITRVEDSTLARQSDVALILPDMPEACAIGMAPTTSTTCALALGDALAITMMEERGFMADSFHVFHPGGKLGAQFMRVSDVMHSNSVPRHHDGRDVNHYECQGVRYCRGCRRRSSIWGHYRRRPASQSGRFDGRLCGSGGDP